MCTVVSSLPGQTHREREGEEGEQQEGADRGLTMAPLQERKDTPLSAW